MTESKLEKRKKRSQATWGLGYKHFSSVLNDHDLRVGAEIGVAFGGHSEAILQNTKIEKLYGIDPYLHTVGYDDGMNFDQNDFDELHKQTIERLSHFGNRYHHIRKYSKDAILDIKEQIDFVYIDADHSYDGVWKDLCVWFSKIRDGGIIGGHDYLHPDFPGVQKAIDEFFGRFNWRVHHEGDTVWWVEKKPLPISFFIPAFNCEKTILESIQSIIDTNLGKDDEIVICNDFSTDGTTKILQEFIGKHPYTAIKIVSHTCNKGGATARNTAIEHTKHELLFCLDSDNVLAPHSVTPLKQYMMNTGADVAAFQNTYFFEHTTDKLHKKSELVSGKVTIEDCLEGKSTPPPSGNYLFTKQSWLLAKGYPDGNWLDTWGFGIRQLFAGAKMFTLPGSFYYHRRGHESYWVREVKKTPVGLVALQNLIPYLHLLSRDSVNYIMGRGRNIWFENLSKRPLKLRKKPLSPHDTFLQIKQVLKKTFPNAYAFYLKKKFG